MLYDFSPEILELMDALIEDPENQAIEDTLTMLIEEDIDTACRIMRQFDAEAEALKKESDFFARKAKSRQNAKNYIRGKILSLMLLTNNRKIKTAENTVSVTTRSKFVLDVDPNDLPEEFKKVTVEPKLMEIGKAMKEEDRGWGHFEQTESLTVR